MKFYVRSTDDYNQEKCTLSDARHEAKIKSRGNQQAWFVINREDEVVEIWYQGFCYQQLENQFDYTPHVDWEEFQYAELAVETLEQLGITGWDNIRTIGDIDRIREQLLD